MKRSTEGATVTALVLETFRLNGQLLEAGDRLTAPLGLTSARWQILGAIKEEARPLTVAQIGRRMGLSRQAVQRVVNDLESNRFVTLEDNPDHKRAKLVVLTGSTLETLRELDRLQTAWVNELAEGLPERDLKRTLKIMSELRQRCVAIEQKHENQK